MALLAVVLNRLTRTPIGVMVAMRSHLARPNAAAEELVSRLADSVGIVRLELGTLARSAVAALVADTLGAVPNEGLADEVHRRVDGNPYFAVEIAHSLADAGLVTVDAAGARLAGVPPRESHLSRRSAVLRRVLPLDPCAQAVAGALAVLRGADLARMGLIASVTSLSEASVAAAFDDLVRAHVVVAAPDGTYRFSHDIVSDAVYDEICARALSLLAERAPERSGLLALQCRAQARASRPAAAVTSGIQALGMLPPGDERFRTAVAVLASLFSLGRIEEAITIADEQVRVPGAPAALHAQRAMLLVFADRVEEA